MKEQHKESIALDARMSLQLLHAQAGQDFHTLSTDQVEQVLVMADQAKYRKPKNANGSRARYFYQRLQRHAAMRILVLTVLMLAGLAAGAQQTTLVLPLLTHHFPLDAGMNDHNWGIGVERQVTPHWSLLAEDYRNSFYRQTVVVGGSWMPVRVGRATLGLAAGLDLTHGYRSNPVSPLLVDARAVIPMRGRWAVGLDLMPGPQWGLAMSARYQIGTGRRRVR